MSSAPLRTRFAPSPTGLLHVGNVRTALFNWLLARAGGGVFVLRVEDTDLARSAAGHVAALEEDLRWLGLGWQEGPGAGGDNGPYLQSQRGDIYAHHFDALIEAGMAYPCFCTELELEVERKTQVAAGRPPRYSGKCRARTREDVAARVAHGERSTLRFHIPENGVVEFDDAVRGHQAFNTADIGDFVIRRSDGVPTFFFSNAVDDALMGVSIVIRGEDHLTNTPRQIMLLHALGMPVPRYGHIALVLGEGGGVLRKREGAFSVRELREAGYLPLAIVNYLARLGHTYEDNALLDMDGLARGFDVARLHKAPAHFDPTQLLHWQRLAVAQADADTLLTWVGAETLEHVPSEQRVEFIETIRGNLVFPADALEWAQRLYSERMNPTTEGRAAIASAGSDFFATAVASLADAADPAGFMARVKNATGRSGKELFMPIRAALTGTTHGPELPRLFALLGAERARARFAAAATLATA
jgi:glutamyl-tRNA synthetase